MKKISLLFCAVLILLVVSPAQAVAHTPTGDRINLSDSTEQEYPANTAFYIYHGWIMEKKEPTGLVGFSLVVDGVLIQPTYIDHSKSSMTDNQIFWIYNFPEGMTGTHTFEGHWTIQCNALFRYGLVTGCDNPAAKVDYHVTEVEVTFTE